MSPFNAGAIMAEGKKKEVEGTLQGGPGNSTSSVNTEWDKTRGSLPESVIHQNITWGGS